MVITILLGFVHGMRRTMLAAAAPGNWIIVYRGVKSEACCIDHENLRIIAAMPQLALDRSGAALISPEWPMGFDPTPDAPRASMAFLRAVHPMAYRVHRGIRLIEGRLPERGKNEWIVGQRLAARHPSLQVGSTFHWSQTDWRVVGLFSDNGSARESEAWGDFDDILTARHLSPGTFGAASFHVILKPGEENSLREGLHADGRLKVDLKSERDFYQETADFSDQLRKLGMAVALILGAGSAFGAMNTMYAAVARRKCEVGTLRALGFGRASVLIAFLVESVILAIAGGAIGEMVAIVLADATGLEGRLMSAGTVLFSFSWSGSAFVTGLAVAVMIGIGGGLLPAWQAAQLSIVNALRDHAA
jgi:putative ABC transport system permease protein